MEWFGKNWGAPVNEGPHAETPIGATCPYCQTEIVDGDRGFLMPLISDDLIEMIAYHHRCLMEWIVPN